MSSSSQSAVQLFCGPEDPSVLYLQRDHITRRIWAGQDRKPLQVRRYESKLWDCKPIHGRVVEYIHEFGFGGVLTCGKPRDIDHHLITALVERWRPETHSFHLPIGEATVTLQDVEVLLGLRVNGFPVTGVDLRLTTREWMQQCYRLLGFIPRDTEMKANGLSVASLVIRMSEPLRDDLDDEVYLQRARMYVLALIGGLIFPDGTGCKVPLIYLTLLEDVNVASQYSWGSAALAMLYHNLCQAACDRKMDVGGAVVLLQFWAWERIPIVRPEFRYPPVHTENTPGACMWNGPTSSIKSPQHCTELYRDQLARLQPEQFIWQPYSHRRFPYYCVASESFWRATTFLICWHIVEPYEPHRVMRQFGFPQHIPQLENVAFTTTHMDTCRRGKPGKDWYDEHRNYIEYWDSRHRLVRNAVEDTSGRMTQEYMRWYRSITVTYITRPGVQSQLGIQESASSQNYALEALNRIYHRARQTGCSNPACEDIIQMAEDALTRCGEGVRIAEPPVNRTQIDTSMPFIERAQRTGNKGVRTGGPRNSLDWQSYHRNREWQDEFVPPSSHEWEPWPEQTFEGSPMALDQSTPQEGYQIHRGSVDSYFSGVQFEAPQESPGDDESADDEDAGLETIPEPRHAPSAGSREGLGRTLKNLFTRRSKRDNKGKGPSKYTPSAYK